MLVGSCCLDTTTFESYRDYVTVSASQSACSPEYEDTEPTVQGSGVLSAQNGYLS